VRDEGGASLDAGQQSPCLFDVQDFHHLAIERRNPAPS
jgi:hypothetical protein